MFRKFITSGMSDVHRRLIGANYFAGLGIEEFAEKIGPILGDVNYVHPFREGNGRTQLYYLKQLCGRAGHNLDLRHIKADAWMNASRKAHGADYSPMVDTIRVALCES